MFTAVQLDQAQYTVRHEQESQRPLNVGTIEIGGGQFGPYLMTPVPPFGSLTNDQGSISGLKQGTHVPQKNLSIEYGPRGIPFQAKAGDTVLHEYGDGTL